MMNGAKSTSSGALPFDVIDLTPTTVLAYRPTPVDVPSTTSNLSPGGRFSVAPGDVLTVRIFERYAGGVFPTVQTGGASFSQRVTDDGTIGLPYVGVVHVAGMDLSQIQSQIERQLGSSTQDPQVLVDYAADRNNTVMISGDVKSPGRIVLSDGTRTIVDAVNHAGGLASTPTAGGATQPSPASQYEVVLRRNGEVILDKQYSELLAGADVPIYKGDEIVVRPNPRTFTVLGAVTVAGNVALTNPNMTLLEALGEVHGLTDLRANKTGIYLFRMGEIQTNPAARARIFRLDLMQPVSVFVAQQFKMEPKDVIYVSSAPLYEYDKALTEIYKTLSVFGVLNGTLTQSVTF